MVARKTFFLIFALILVIASAATAQEVSPVRIGCGAGLPYGGVGLNTESQDGSQLAATFGLGWALGCVGWNGGLRYYFSAPKYGRNRGLRMTALYGVNTIIRGDGYQMIGNDTKTGLSVGLGTQGKKWNFDLFYIITPSLDRRYEREGGDIFISFGYMFGG